MKIGFVGAGIMGHGMALNLLRAGHDVTVVAHKNRAPIDDLVANGAGEAASIEQLASRSDIVVLCLTGTQVARSVIRDLTPHLTHGVMVIDTTTNEPDGPEELAATLKEGGCRYVEAPITGGVIQAKDGLLGAIVGCDEADFVRAKEILGGFCKQVERFGPVGMGVRAKLVSNFLALGTATLVIETFKQARSLGVDWKKLYELAQLGSGNSSGLKRIVGAALNEDYRGYVFTIKNSAKDFSYICKLADDNRDGSKLAPVMKAIYERAISEGYGDHMLSELLDPALGGDQQR